MPTAQGRRFSTLAFVYAGRSTTKFGGVAGPSAASKAGAPSRAALVAAFVKAILPRRTNLAEASMRCLKVGAASQVPSIRRLFEGLPEEPVVRRLSAISRLYSLSATTQGGFAFGPGRPQVVELPSAMTRRAGTRPVDRLCGETLGELLWRIDWRVSNWI